MTFQPKKTERRKQPPTNSHKQTNQNGEAKRNEKKKKMSAKREKKNGSNVQAFTSDLTKINMGIGLKKLDTKIDDAKRLRLTGFT